MSKRDDLCVCGVPGYDTTHWNSPTGWTSIVTTCGDACADAVEAVRVDGVLTLAAVRAIRVPPKS